MKTTHLFLTIAIIAAFLSSCNPTEKVDFIIHNAKIYTVDDNFTVAQAMAITDGKIVKVGAEHEIMNAYHSDSIYDARGGFIYPGFIDAHAHFLGYGIEKQRLDLLGTTSFDEVIQRIADHIKSHDDRWVLGRGWDQNDWESKSFPSTDTLQKLFPEHYIALKRIDGHAFLVSPNVLALAGITNETKVEGGKVIVNGDRPSGILLDEAMTLVEKLIPEPSLAFKTDALLLAQSDCFGAGLTSVCDAGLSVSDIQLIDSLQQSQLAIRIYAMYSAHKDLLGNLEQHYLQSERLRAAAVKVYADGALGSRGALLLEPYADDTTHYGLLITPKDSIIKWAEACKAAGFQLNVHCIGDSANRLVLQSMGTVLGGNNDLRWRIEHAQVVNPKDLPLFGRYNILPSVQPTHATSDMYWAEQRLGKMRVSQAYNLESLKNQNGLLALGTDFPVEGISPLATFYAAVFRKDAKGYPEDGFMTNEGLSKEDALRGITIWAAISNFNESTVGSIEAGKFADFVLLDQDLINCSEEATLKTQVQKTWVNGKQVYKQ